MRFCLFILILILFSLSSNAGWQAYQNDLRNTGIANGTGYFPLKTTNFSNELYGMDFQPLISDINNDGYNELVIFYNELLKVFDYELSLIDEKFAGTLLGQPAVFNNNIIFNSRIDNKDYFFAYELNGSGLNQRFNVTLSNAADFSGIKCLNLNGTDSCIFKDKRNYVHIISLDSRIDNSYNTSVYNETRQTVPAIGDIDNDGSQEAVFWHNEGVTDGYGFLVFDLGERKVEWIVDNIFAPSGSYVLKGQPVLADLNNDNRLEIAGSVFYNDNIPSHNLNDDWFTELFVYSHNGSKLFSKCEKGGGNTCNDGSSGTDGSHQWEGTNPFVLNINNSGADAICFIKDKKSGGGFKNMTISCYNHSGDLLLDSELSPSTETVKTAIAADMNNDGKKEIVTENRVYTQNGTPIFLLDLGSDFVIPVDIDGNNRLDLVWTKNGMTKTFVDDSGAIKVSDVLIKPENPSVEDSLSCQWKASGNSKIIYANASWHKNNAVYSNEVIACVNNTLCVANDTIPPSALTEDDIWKCSVVGFENDKKSLTKSDTALVLSNEWPDFNKNRLSYGTAPGNGHFSKSAVNALSYNTSGLEFAPMAADIDAKGETEIVLFANSSLILLDKALNVIAQMQTGNLRGQFDIANMDNDAYIEIIAVVNNSNHDKFTVFSFNGSELKIKSSFNVTSQNGFQDMRCIDFDKDNETECIYRDFNGIAHSYQMNATSQNDDELSVNISDVADNVYESKVNIAPSFADFDRDNDLDALFCFNDNFVVLDSSKNVVLNVDVGTLKSFISSEPSFLGLKFVNLDKAGDYEIAVAYRYDNLYLLDMRTEINLSLFNSKGKAVFSKIFNFYTGNCGSAYHEKLCLGLGSDLFVHDYNKDGFDDLGIYLEGTYDSAYGKFIRVSDRNGNEIASNKVEFGEESSTAQAATLADIDGDNELELILRRRSYNLDGSVLYNFTGIADKAPIAVDMDKNKALDLLWFNSSQLILLLDNSSHKADLYLTDKDISFSPLNSTSALVTVNVHSNVNLNNVKLRLTNTETGEAADGTTSIDENSFGNFTAALRLKRHDKIMAQANYDDSIEESDNKNNFAEKEYMGLPYVYVSADLNPFTVNSEFQDYIKNKLISGYYTAKESEADVKVYIGKNNQGNSNNKFRLPEFGVWYDYGDIEYYDKTGTLPYNSLIAAFKDNSGERIVMIVGNEVEGDIIGAKKFIENQALLLNTDKDSVFVDDENADAVKVYDYLHLGGNEEHYGLNNEQFRRIVRNALNDEMFNVFDKNVVTNDGITLRLRNLKPNMSNDYLEYLNSTGVPVEMPVVLAHGLFSNLTTWEVLGAELSNVGRDTWLIEITGGPGQDCDSCIDYSFYNLTDIFVPALLNGVLNFTNKDKIQYVGFSNGCRAALDSLERNKFDSNKVETFVAVGCPGAFEKLSLLDSGIVLVDDRVLENLQNKNVNHVDVGDLLKSGLLNKNTITKKETGKISLNLWKKYLYFISSTNDTQPGKINLTKFGILQGNALGTSDGIVPTLDEDSIYSNVKLRNSNSEINPMKQSFKVLAFHTNVDTTQKSKTLIRKLLNNEELSFFEKTFNLLNQSEAIG